MSQIFHVPRTCYGEATHDLRLRNLDNDAHDSEIGLERQNNMNLRQMQLFRLKSGRFNLFFFILALALAILTVVVSRDQEQVARRRRANRPSQSYWTCSMHPQVQEVAPGRCPICHMSLNKVD